MQKKDINGNKSIHGCFTQKRQSLDDAFKTGNIERIKGIVADKVRRLELSPENMWRLKEISRILQQ